MNKKGIFFSISAILILFILFVNFQNWAKGESEDKRFIVDRAQILVFDHFVRDFDSYYIEEILKGAAKPALVALATGSTPVSAAELVELMKDGSSSGANIDQAFTTDDNFKQALSTLSFEPETKDFSYDIVSISQTAYNQFEIEFSANYKFAVLGDTWVRSGKHLRIPISAESLPHPRFSGTYGLIDSSWVSEPSPAKCYVEEFFAGATPIVCSTRLNIQPPIIITVPTP